MDRRERHLQRKIRWQRGIQREPAILVELRTLHKLFGWIAETVRRRKHLLEAALLFQDAKIIFVQIPCGVFTFRFVSKFDSRALGNFPRKDQPLTSPRSAHSIHEILHSFLDELPV